MTKESNPIVISIVGGLLSATLSVLHLFSFPALIFLSYFSALPLFLIGLGLGLRPLYGATLVASLTVLAFEGPLMGIEFLVGSVLGPVFLVNRALLHRKTSSGKNWYPASLLLRDITLIAGLIMVIGLGLYLYFIQSIDVRALIKVILETFDPQKHMQNGEALLQTMFTLLPGFFAFSWFLMMLFNGTIAQGILVRQKRNLRPSPTLGELETPKSFLIALGVSLALSFVGLGALELLGKNAALVLILPFFLVGLGVVHRWLHKFTYASFALALFYLLLILLFWPAFFVIVLGILKPWIEKMKSENE